MKVAVQTGNERKSNLELLRCVLIVFVIVLHYNNRNLGGALQYVVPGSVSSYFLYLTEAMSICAVNTFILISGYFLSESRIRKINKGIYLLTACVGYKLLSFCVNIILGRAAFSWKLLLRNLIPDNYYVILYVVLFFVSVYINFGVERLDKKQYKNMLILLLTIFVVWENFWDLIKYLAIPDLSGISAIGMGGGQEGYTIVNFVLLYLIGGYLKKFPVRETKLAVWAGGYIISTGIIFVESLYTPTALFYNNLIVIIQSICIFKFFEGLQIGYSKLINSLAGTVFTTYLFHLTIMPFFNIQRAVQKGAISMVLNMAICICTLFAVCVIISFVVSWVIAPIKKKIDYLTGNIKLP